jgi:hypothetical protein
MSKYSELFYQLIQEAQDSVPKKKKSDLPKCIKCIETHVLPTLAERVAQGKCFISLASHLIPFDIDTIRQALTIMELEIDVEDYALATKDDTLSKLEFYYPAGQSC